MTLLSEQARHAAGGASVAEADWLWLQEQAAPALDLLQEDWAYYVRQQVAAVLAYAAAHANGKGEAAARKSARQALGDAQNRYHEYDADSKGRRGGRQPDDIASPVGLADALAEGAQTVCEQQASGEATEAQQLLRLMRLLDVCHGAMAALALGDGNLRALAAARLTGVWPVIFLDIDHTITSQESLRAYHQREESDRIGWTDIMTKNQVFWDENCMAELRRVLTATGARVVMSSSWRNIHPLSEFSVMLALYDCPADVLGATPNLPPPRSRGKEIQAWLDLHPGVDRYVILDDYDPPTMAIPTEAGQARHVHVDEDTGLTTADADQAIALLS